MIAAVAVGVVDAWFDEWTIGTVLTMLFVGGAVFVGVGAVRSRLWDRRKR